MMRTDLLQRDLSGVAGIAINCQSGEKSIHIDESLKGTSSELPMKLSLDSTMATKESSNGSICSAMSSTRSSVKRSRSEEMTVSQQNKGKLSPSNNTHRSDFSDWESRTEISYSEEEVLSIHGMISYFQNRYNGYGKYNDEELFQDEISSVRGKELLKEALQGWKLLKACKTRQRSKVRN